MGDTEIVKMANTKNRNRRGRRSDSKRYAMQPAEHIINGIFDGPELLAIGLKCHPTTLYRCLKPKTVGGTDGEIPQRLQKKMLAWARQTKRRLAPSDFFTKGD